jgi:hypothetical protein
VLSALLDERQLGRQQLTKQFWRRRSEFYFGTSDVCRVEISRHNDITKRTELLALLENLELVNANEECRNLASKYIAGRAFSQAMYDDAMHVATATVHGYDILVSWNFRHLVNRRRKAVVLGIHATLGYPAIDIVAPPEL